MSTHLARHFKKARSSRNLKPSELARLAGCKNIHKSAGRIRRFESTGEISSELLAQLAVALKIDDATIESLVEMDHLENSREWQKWVNKPIRPYLAIRLMPCVYQRQPIPNEITCLAEAEELAGAVAAKVQLKCCLVWSRRISSWFLHDGKLDYRSETVPGEPNEPYTMIGNYRFTLGKGRKLVKVGQGIKRRGRNSQSGAREAGRALEQYRRIRRNGSVKGKRYYCDICRRRSSKLVYNPAPWYCSNCVRR